MREKIERFANGLIEYEVPLLILSEKEISISVEEGKIYEGSFTIHNSIGSHIKGVLYSSSSMLTLDTDSFYSDEHKVNYRFDATYEKAGEVIQGEISIITDCGERILPFTVTVVMPYIETAIGKIGDLFQFTNLAKQNWSEAKRVFRSEDFERIFLKKEKYKLIYQGLIKSTSTSQALEEFLIATHKKSRISLSVDRREIEYQVNDETFMDKLILSKNNWGYAQIKVSTDADFIQLDQKYLWADSFIGSTHQISFVIDPKGLRSGNNYGRIYIRTVYQTIIVSVSCSYQATSQVNDHKEHKDRDKAWLYYQLTRDYLHFRLNKINLSQYINKTNSIIGKLSSLGEEELVLLLKAFIAVLSGDNNASLLIEMFKDEDILKYKSSVLYCAYHYLRALIYKDLEINNEEIVDNKGAKDTTGTRGKEDYNVNEKSMAEKSSEILHYYYNKVSRDWRILWFIFYTDKRYENDHLLKLANIKEQYKLGCRSPILYYEAANIYNKEPILLKELSDFEIQVMHFAIRNGYLNRETASQYTYLASKKKRFHQLIHRDLTVLYEEDKSNDVLSAICSLLIKGIKKSSRYFIWFRLGVEKQLRITELYEYFMYSISDDYNELLPQPVLLYFIYNSNLNDSKRAFLYANIIKNKEKIETIYRSYYKRIEVFAKKQLEARHLSKNLSIIYEEIFGGKIIESDLLPHLHDILYDYELVCKNPNIISVVIGHKELRDEEAYSLVDGRARVTIYEEDPLIYLVDADNKRYCVTVDYSLHKYLALSKFDDMHRGDISHPLHLLYHFSRYNTYDIMDEGKAYIWERIIKLPGLKDEYYYLGLEKLIEYYNDIDEVDQVEFYLMQIDIHKIRPNKRKKLIEYYIHKRLNASALEGLKTYGFEGVAANLLVKFCSEILAQMEEYIKDEKLLQLCYYVYSLDKYNENILQYLVKYYYGPTSQMYVLWKRAMDFELDTHELEERLLVQMLFTESYVKDSFKVFINYYKNVTNHTLVRAFLSYYGYRYLVHDRVIDDEFFNIMKRELLYEDNDIYLLAWLKYHSTGENYSENDLNFIDYNIHQLERRGLILPFLYSYSKVVKLPKRMMDKYYIDYKTDPRKQVFIHYRLITNGVESDFITERMPNVFMGIHGKEFVLFQHEVLQYYITEEYEGEVNVTESFNVEIDKETLSEDETRYNHINLMLMSKELNDNETLLELMEQYITNEYLISNCFRPIE